MTGNIVWSSFESRILWSTVSKAFCRSTNTPPANSPLSRHFLICSMMSIRAWTVEWPLRNPNCRNQKQSNEYTSPFHKSSRYWVEERWGGSLKHSWGRSLVFEHWDNFRGFKQSRKNTHLKGPVDKGGDWTCNIKL